MDCHGGRRFHGLPVPLAQIANNSGQCWQAPELDQENDSPNGGGLDHSLTDAVPIG
jgi:hypothetical protein